MRTILATTATEIGRALNLQRATMAVGLEEASDADKDRGQENGAGPAYPDMTPDIEELAE
jgi:hypothetical protein